MEVDKMTTIGKMGHIRFNSQYPKQVKVRYIVKDDVKLQVVNTSNNKVVREVPRKLTSRVIHNNLYR